MIRRCPKCHSQWPPEVDYCPRDGTRTTQVGQAGNDSDWDEVLSTADRGSDWVRLLSTGERGSDWNQKPVSKETTAYTDEPAVPSSTPVMAASVQPCQVGDELGSYVLKDLLGEGGMGSVFRAEH